MKIIIHEANVNREAIGKMAVTFGSPPSPFLLCITISAGGEFLTFLPQRGHYGGAANAGHTRC